MNLTEVYSGENDPFEGDLTLWLRGLPEGASATRATLGLKPVAPAGGALFRETIHFNGDQGDLGTRKRSAGNFLEVDFHSRRTLLRAVGTGTAPTLQVDMGGAFIGVADDGTFLANGGTAWPVDLASAEDNLPALTVSRFRLTEPGAGGTSPDLSQVDFRSVPSNLQVRLGQMAPFWVRLGELTQTQTSPDFSPVLNFFLSNAEVENGFFQIPLVIHSDTYARLEITLNVSYVIEQPVLPPHLEEVNLPYDFSTLPAAGQALLTARLPQGAVPVTGRNRATIRGAFDQSRLALGEPGETLAAGTVIVSPGCSLAQPVTAEKEIALTGIDLPLANTRPGLAGLNVSLVEDADGKPSGVVLAGAEVKIGKPLPDGTVWGSAALPEPFRILPGARHWLVLQSRDGEAYWSIAAGSSDQPALQCSRDGGLSWRAASCAELKSPLAALFRLRHVPGHFTVPVQLMIGKGIDTVRRRLDEFAPSGKVAFSFDFTDKLDKQLRQPGAPPPCDGPRPLCNADFALPRPRDATRRLFGFDNAGNWQITSEIDLSRGINLGHERYIVVSVDEGAPCRIDCAGADPARTGIDEIIAAINQGAGARIATQSVTTGGRLQLTSPSGDYGRITLHPWCEVGLPECWQGTAARIRRLRYNRPKEKQSGFAVLLAGAALVHRGFDFHERTLHLSCFADDSPPAPDATGAVLWQRFAVSDRCSYLMSLSYQILTGAPSEEKHACRPEALEAPSWQIEWFDETGTSLQVDSDRLQVTSQSDMDATPQEIRLAPPDKAAQAELRLLHPAATAYGVLIEDLKLTATAQVVLNGDFSHWEEVAGRNIPLDWTVDSGWTEMISGGVLLRGDGPEDTVLLQQVAVTAETEYRLRIKAVSSPITSATENLPEDAEARLEIHWLKEDETQVVETLVLPLCRRAFPTRAWRGTTPAGAKQAKLRIVQPQGEGQLLVEEIRLEKLDLVDVPFTFLGESPGQLKVSDLRVTYDLADAERQPRSAAGTPVIAKNLAQADERQAIALADQPTAVISGIGKRYSEALARRGIRTVGELAAFEGQDVEGISPMRLIELRASAELALDYAGRTTFTEILGARTLEEILAGSPAELARLGGRPLESVLQLRKNLRAQFYLLNNSALGKMKLKDLSGFRPAGSKNQPE